MVEIFLFSNLKMVHSPYSRDICYKQHALLNLASTFFPPIVGKCKAFTLNISDEYVRFDREKVYAYTCNTKTRMQIYVVMFKQKTYISESDLCSAPFPRSKSNRTPKTKLRRVKTTYSCSFLSSIPGIFEQQNQ